MGLRIGEIAPDFQAHTTEGIIRFHEWIGESWCLLFMHQKGLSPICLTEPGELAKIGFEFGKRNVKIVGLTIGPILVGDRALLSARVWRMRLASSPGDASLHVTAESESERKVILIGPDKRVRLVFLYPATTRHAFDEVLSVIDSLQAMAEDKSMARDMMRDKAAIPARWEESDDEVIADSVSDGEGTKGPSLGWIKTRPDLRLSSRAEQIVRPVPVSR